MVRASRELLEKLEDLQSAPAAASKSIYGAPPGGMTASFAER